VLIWCLLVTTKELAFSYILKGMQDKITTERQLTSLENVAKLKHLGRALANSSCLHEKL
jgi:hypothetical protein